MSDHDAPTMLDVVTYWAGDNGDDAPYRAVFPALRAHWVGWGEPFCFRCGWLAPVPDDGNWDAWAAAAVYLELEPLDPAAPATPSNFVPLCPGCHPTTSEHARHYPDRQAADVAYVNEHVPADAAWQMLTDTQLRNGDDALPVARRLGAYRRCGRALTAMAKAAAAAAAERDAT